MNVTIKVFARYAEVLGREAFALHLPPHATVGDAVSLLRETAANGHLLPERPMVALNLEHVLADHPLEDGDELALLPPLAGG